jgi:hypothetical protein
MKYIFIIYINRSGSTFLANQLSKLNEILVCPEAEVLVNMLKNPDTRLSRKEQESLGSAIENDRKLKHWNLDIDLMKTDSQSRPELFFNILDYYRSGTKPNSRIIAFKAVDLINYVDILHDYGIHKGLEIYFISLIRDPRAVFNSQRQTYVDHRKKYMNRNPLTTVYQWNYLLTKSINYASLYKLVILKYEDLVNNLEMELNKLLNIIDVHGEHPFAGVQGDLKARIPLDQLSMHQHITDPPIPAKVNQWQTECKILTQELIQHYTKEGLMQMRYHIIPATQPGIIIQLIHLRYKIELALKDFYRIVRKTNRN